MERFVLVPEERHHAVEENERVLAVEPVVALDRLIEHALLLEAEIKQIIKRTKNMAKINEDVFN